VLKRAYTTADIILRKVYGDDESSWPEVRRSIALIERHYGALTGKNKAQMVKEYGEAQVGLVDIHQTQLLDPLHS
jgi:bisphosphoglycerate-dependent phosphoglycerate mutase